VSAYEHVSTAAARLAEARASLPPGALELACHAAVPVAVDPALLNLLRINFFVDPPHDLPWTVEAALLTSPLFRDLGGGLYEIDDDLRRSLLVSLRTAYPPDRAVQVALLLERYCERPDVWSAHPMLEQAQQLTAIGIIDPPRASRWLEDAARDPGVQVGLSKEWFVAMRGRLDRQPDPSRSLTDEITEEIGRLPSDAAVRRLAELGLLPGADLDLIRDALRAETSDAAAGALRVLGSLAGERGAVAFDTTGGPVPLTDLIGMPYPQPFDAALHWAPRSDLTIPFAVDPDGVPVRLDLDADGPGLITAVEGAGRRELLRTIVLALAATYPPDRLQLVLIDVSGARTFDRLSGLPHVVGHYPGPVTGIGARQARDDLQRVLQSRGRPRLVVIVDDFVLLTSGHDTFEQLLLHLRQPGVSVLVAAMAYPTDLRDLAGRRPGYRVDLGSGSSTEPGHGTFTTDVETQIFAAATFVPRGPGDDETVAGWLTRNVVRAGIANDWLVRPPPDRRPALFDLLGTPQEVDGRGLTVVPADPPWPVGGTSAVVGRFSGGGNQPVWLDLTGANLAIVGRAVATTTDVLLAVVLSLALRRTPREAQFILIDGTGGLAPLGELPHVRLVADAKRAGEARAAVALVTDILQRREGADPPQDEVFLVINRWDRWSVATLDLASIAEAGTRRGIHVLAVAGDWDRSAIPARSATAIELELDDPSTSVIAPDLAAELSGEVLETGLTKGGDPFIPALVKEGPAADNAAALAGRIAASWHGPTVRDQWIPKIAPRDYFYISHSRDDSLSYAQTLYNDLGAVIRRRVGLGDEVHVGSASFTWSDGSASTPQIETTLNVCQTFISVHGSGYFQDADRAREWNLFHARGNVASVVKTIVATDSDPSAPRGAGYEATVSGLADEIVANALAQRIPSAFVPRRLDQMRDTFPLPGPRFALVIGTSRYTDPALEQLAPAAPLVESLTEVLAAPDIGGFVVTKLLDVEVSEVRRVAQDFLARRDVDDLVLIYFVGRSLLSAGGQPVLAVADSEHRRLNETGIRSAWLFDLLDDCPAHRQIVVLDVVSDRAWPGLGIPQPTRRLVGAAASRAVMTSTSRPDDPALTFSTELVHGLRTSAIELNEDDQVTVRAAYDYAFKAGRFSSRRTGPELQVSVNDALALILAQGRRRP
jgi:S-DNA-T family DNA segregation ATPase FtsK/SpoIIIE